MEKKIIFHDFSYANVHQFDETSCFFIYISYIPELQGNDNIIQYYRTTSRRLVFPRSFIFLLRVIFLCEPCNLVREAVKNSNQFCLSAGALRATPLVVSLAAVIRVVTKQRSVACVTTFMTAAKETTPLRSGFFRLLAISTNLRLNRVCGQANGRYTSHITLRCVTLLTVKVEHNRKPKKSSMKTIRQNQTRLK